jgi:hypothetical protein
MNKNENAQCEKLFQPLCMCMLAHAKTEISIVTNINRSLSIQYRAHIYNTYAHNTTHPLNYQLIRLASWKMHHVIIS